MIPGSLLTGETASIVSLVLFPPVKDFVIKALKLLVSQPTQSFTGYTSSQIKATASLGVFSIPITGRITIRTRHGQLLRDRG